MRVLFLSPAGGLGGGERCLLDLMASMRAHAPRVELGLVAGGDGPLVERAEALGARVIHLPLDEALARLGDSGLMAQGARSIAATAGRLIAGGIVSTRYVGSLRAAIREFAPSVVHSNGIKTHLLAAAARPDAPLVWHIRDFIGQRALVPIGLRAVAWRADAAIAISNAVGDDARRVLPHLPISVIYDAIDTDVFTPEGPAAPLDALAGHPPAPARCVKVGLVATYARWKGQDVFLEAARIARAAPAGADVVFYVVGGPIYDTVASQYQPDELTALARDLGVEDRVRFVPFQARIEEVFRALDVVVHASSRPEPFGRTIAEGMATGKAVVVSRASGAAELFADGDGECAVSVTPRDAPALAAAILALAGDAGMRRRLGAAARTTAVARLSRGRLASEVFDVYAAAARRRPSPGAPGMGSGGTVVCEGRR